MFARGDFLEKLKKIDLISSVENTIAGKLEIKSHHKNPVMGNFASAEHNSTEQNAADVGEFFCNTGEKSTV